MRLLIGLLTITAAFGQDPELRLEPLITGLRNPVDIQSPRDGSGRLFIVEQAGTIRIFANGQLRPGNFLDISARTLRDGECGLLGLAFPPDFARKRHFYVNYTDTNCTNSIVARYRLSGDDNVADPGSEQVVMRLAQPFRNHNGGQLAFGPDGYLYIGWGDGGSGRDPQNHGQNRQSLLGKMLRLDVESDLTQYRIPAGNPFVNTTTTRPEVWALGLRNPWRYSFDRVTGDLWIADVGQNRAEEINFQPASSAGGENYGWRTMEGLQCLFQPCNPADFTLPVHEYTRAQGDVSVTGGYVYRGPVASSLTGTYLYGDFASGRIWGLRRENGRFVNRLLLSSGLAISSFGEDQDGTLYVANHRGTVVRVVPLATRAAVASAVNGASFREGLVPGSAATLFTRGIVTTPGVTAATAIPLPTTLAGVRVRVNGREAPLYAVANVNGSEQVNFQVPFETGAPSAAIVASFEGTETAAYSVPVLAAQPGVFAQGDQAILVRSADNALLTEANPARPGELVYLYAAGLGAVDNPPATGAAPGGLARTRATVNLTVGNRPAEVLFSGLAPGFVGVYQINARLAADVPPGRQALVLAMGAERSEPTFVHIR
mgnify:CR=1 FL=1